LGHLGAKHLIGRGGPLDALTEPPLRPVNTGPKQGYSVQNDAGVKVLPRPACGWSVRGTFFSAED